ncbi:hypothetical protein BKA62DRAFT_833501 [Auriculariales sp. MPI-PUGE-AT-0066]|nr:hypothetical protein BKA62DRAFT_833501 [Auriculariales sp. MPI-PUGE-AT-0066]
MFSRVFVSLALFTAVLAAPVKFVARQNPCFVVGNVALPAEVADSLAGLSGVTCSRNSDVAFGVPDVVSGGISFSSIDFRNSGKSPVGFALQAFAIPDDPAQADVAKLQNQLNVYLAVEAGLRSVDGTKALLGQLKGAKFFAQFQMARINTANGVRLGVADTVEHQLGKVLKNAAGASAAEKAEVQRLSTLV